MMRSAVIVAMVGAAASMTCPLGDASNHGIQITLWAQTDCDHVEGEIKNRVLGQHTGRDGLPWNHGGKYTLEEDVPFGGTVATSRLDGNGQPTLKQVFTLSSLDGNGQPTLSLCKIEACANSLVPGSIGSSYCDLKMLYCTEDDGCFPMHQVMRLSPETLQAAGTFTMGQSGSKGSFDAQECRKGTSTPPMTEEQARKIGEDWRFLIATAAKDEKADATVIA